MDPGQTGDAIITASIAFVHQNRCQIQSSSRTSRCSIATNSIFKQPANGGPIVRLRFYFLVLIIVLLLPEVITTNMPPAPASKENVHANAKTDISYEVSQLPIVFVMGGPGSGKGTQCGLIKERFGYTHLSTGDLLRDEVSGGSTRGQWLNSIMLKGDLVPLETVLTLLKEAILREAPHSKGYLIDGFPREVSQAVEFEKQVGPCSMVIYFEVPFDIMTQRLIERGKTSGRLDDNEATIRKRLQTFADQTVPVVNHYTKCNKTFIVGANRDIDAVFDDVTKILGSYKPQPACLTPQVGV